VDVSIEECSGGHTGYAGGLDSAGFLHAERVRVVRCNLLRPMSGGVITVWGSSTWTDCIVADNHGVIWCATGMHTFTRITVLRTSALQNPEWGSIAISAGTTTMIDSRVADAGSPCVVATETGTLVLRNTTLSNCSAPRRDFFPAFVSRTYLAMSDEAATNFQSELLTLEPSCEEDPSAALIGVDSAFTAPLNARGLRVVAPATCASTKFAVVSDRMRLVNCSDGEHVCGAAATCTDVQLMSSVPFIKTAICSCQGEYVANPNGSSLALAPYGFDSNAIGLGEDLDPTTIGLPGMIIDYCVRALSFLNQPPEQAHASFTNSCEPRVPTVQITPRRVRNADLSNYVLEKVLRLSKTESLNAEHTLKLTIDMEGTNIFPGTWVVDDASIPFWLSLPLLEGNIGATEPSSNFSITANTAGLPEKATPYTTALQLSVTSQRSQSFVVPVELYVSAPTLASTSIWGRPTKEEHACHEDTFNNAPIKVVVGKAHEVPFTACDFEGLAVQHADDGSFGALLIDRSSGGTHSLQISYDLSGTHLVIVQQLHLGEFGLRLNFTTADGKTEQVGIERSVQVICPPASGQTALSDGLTCGCVAGAYFDVDVRACEPCPVGEYCPEGATLGNRCPVGFTTEGAGAKSLDECGCPSGTYDSAAADGITGCKPCNRHMDCTRTGLTLATLPLLPSRWRLSNRTASASECTSSAGLGGDWNGTSDAFCAQGYEGPLCEWCSDLDQYYDDASATCKDCGDMVSYAFRQIVILLAIAVALGLLRAAVLRAPRLLVRTSRRLAQAAISMQQFGLQAKFKCCLTFYQVWAVRKSVYGFELPGDLGSVMAFFDALSFDVGSFIFPSWTCLGGLTARLVFSGLWPLGLMGAVALCLLGLEAVRKGSLQRALLRSLQVAIFISFCVLPSVTRSLFLAFKCESFGYDDLASPPESRPYLSASFNVQCYSPEHAPIYATAWVFIVMWPLALPLLYGALLFRCRRAILNHQPSTLSRAIRFLWFDYANRCFWFEMVELVQKLVLTNFLLFVNFEEGGSNKLLRLFIGLLIALFGLTVQLIAQPFRNRSDDAIASVVRLMLVLFFILGIMVKLCDIEDPNAIHSLLDAQIEASQFCFTLVGVNTTEAVAWLILCAGLLVVLVPLGMLVQTLVFSHSIPILRDARTMEPPVLLLRAGERYHLFLSHVWSTGQDQCAVIKRQLQLLLPGVVIFLDVDGTPHLHLPLPFHPTPLIGALVYPLGPIPWQICRILATWRATFARLA
jgi:hypothetical protein